MSKNKIINIRIESELKKQAKKLAQEEGRSLSNWVTWLIQREVKEKGQQDTK
ncbi:MAG: toxin-antitoxin system HicB family antitoxin [Chromatiales bacterium]|nr:toxin-antitoxin system HicB family antitoxin [Chromatiales bacterium]